MSETTEKMQKTVLQQIGDRVYAGRMRRGFSRKQLADRAGVSAEVLTRMERGVYPVSIEEALKICGELEFSVEYIMTGNCGFAEYVRMQQKILNMPIVSDTNLHRVATAFWDTLPQGGRGVKDEI